MTDDPERLRHIARHLARTMNVSVATALWMIEDNEELVAAFEPDAAQGSAWPVVCDECHHTFEAVQLGSSVCPSCIESPKGEEDR